MVSPSSEGFFINTSDQIREVIDRITSLAPQEQAVLFVDLEGRTLGRGGTISILQIYAEPLNEVYFLDIKALQTASFITGSKNDISSKNILEDDKITKAVFDVRSESGALHFHNGIKLQGVVNIQLRHNVPIHQNQQLRGLGHCVDQFAAAYSQDPKGAHKYQSIDKDLFTALEATTLAKIKNGGQEMFRADAIIGTSFDERPIMKDLLLYSIHDVVMMPKLYRDYMMVLTRNQLANALKASQHRIRLSLRKNFQPGGWSPWATKNEDPIKIFWDFSEGECLAERHKTTWTKNQVKDRYEYELKHRVSRSDTPEHWGDERVQSLVPTGRP